MLQNHNVIKQEINTRKRAGKSQNMWILSSTLLSNIWIKVEISREKFYFPCKCLLIMKTLVYICPTFMNYCFYDLLRDFKNSFH